MADLRLLCLLEEETLILAAIGVLLKNRIDNRTRRRRFWTRRWILRRPLYGQYECLMAELAVEDRDGYRNFQRVPPDLFQEILGRVRPRISKRDTFFRTAIDPGLRLAVTLRYLATGDSYMSLQYGFRVANNSISRIIPEVCEAIVEEYIGEVMVCPTTPEGWKEISDRFSQRWNFHNTIGALDGKHIAIRKPIGGGSWFYNYKGFHSIILMALVDADYKFIYVDVGANGRCSDGGVFSDCSLRRALEDGTLGLPDPAPMPNDDKDMPYKIVADDAFPMREWLMKPYPQRFLTREQRIYNYRLSRARRVVENAFGILAHRFRCLLTTCQQKYQNVESIVMCCCVLHYLMRLRYPGMQNQHVDREDPDTRQLIPGAWRDVEVLTALQGMRGNHATTAAKSQRQYLMDYYNSPAGRVAWQDRLA